MTKTNAPLYELALRLRGRVPRLACILGLFQDCEYLPDFVKIVRMFIPDKETEIMHLTTEDKIGMFLNCFGEKYFELDDSIFQYAWENGEELLPIFIDYIPATPRGIRYEDFTEFAQWKDGRVLLAGLVKSPYEIPEVSKTGCHGMIPLSSPTTHGERVPILDAVGKMVGKELVKLIPEWGWDRKHLRRKLKNTRFAAAADFADVVWGQTGSWWLDSTPEDGSYFYWSRGNVNQLMREQKKANAINKGIGELTDWLEKNPKVRYAELLNAVLEPKPGKSPKTLCEIFAREAKNGNSNRGKEKQNGRLRQATTEDIAAAAGA